MPQREPRHVYSWRSFNPVYGPWYRLIQAGGKTISGGEAVVMPDMDKGRWFWTVRIGTAKAPRETLSGHEPTLDEAKRVAKATFADRY